MPEITPEDDGQQVVSPHVSIKFKTGSSLKGGEGYDLHVTSDANQEEIDGTLERAFAARRKVLTELGAPTAG
jgi:hypothetical protein